MRDLVTINGVTGFLDGNGTAHLKLEDVARGLGFTQTAKSGNEVVRWERVRGYLIEMRVVNYAPSPLVGTGDLPEFIPENIFYKLCFKAANETARQFQEKVTDEILPTIRKTGGYVANDDLFIETYWPHADESMKQMFRAALATARESNKKAEQLEVKLNESEKYWTIMKFNQIFNLHWDMKTCQRNGKAASVYSRQHGYEIRKCLTNDERFKETNSYAYEVLETLFLPRRGIKGGK